MNVEKIDKLIERLRSLPEAHPPTSLMVDWFQSSECGTVGCIAGEACLMEGILEHERPIPVPRRVARRILGLDREQCNALFHVDNWPESLRDEWYDATAVANCKASTERKLMIKRLEFLKELGR